MNFRDLPPPSIEGPPRALRALGLIAMATVVISTLFTDPKPGLHGDGPLVIVAIVAARRAASSSACGARSGSRTRASSGCRSSAIATLIFASVQPDSAGYAGVYFVMAIGGIRLGRDGAIVVCGGTVGGLVLIQLLEHENPAVIAGTLFSVLPWFLVMRLVRRLATQPPREGSWRSCASRAPRTPSRPRWPSAAGSRASCTTCSRTRCPRSRCSSRARACWPATAAPTPT